jgi:hypothetical protein
MLKVRAFHRMSKKKEVGCPMSRRFCETWESDHGCGKGIASSRADDVEMLPAFARERDGHGLCSLLLLTELRKRDPMSSRVFDTNFC